MAASGAGALSFSSDSSNKTLKDYIPMQLAMIKALLDEYIEYRKLQSADTSSISATASSMWRHPIGVAKKLAGQDHFSERKKDCVDILNDLDTASVKTQSDLIPVIFTVLRDCESKARILQTEAAKNADSWFKSDASDCARVLHAVRTCLYAGAMSSLLRVDFLPLRDAKIQFLLDELAKTEREMDAKIDSHTDVSRLDIIRDNTIGYLLALQNIPTIKLARLQKRYEIYEPLNEKSKDPSLPLQIRPDPNIPNIFNETYFYMYYFQYSSG